MTNDGSLAVKDVQLEVLRAGSGENLLLLHDFEYMNEPQQFHELLSPQFSLLAPSHPGFGASELPPGFDNVEDLALLYLDLLAEIGPAYVMGMGFGGWIAAEMAVRCAHEMRALALVDAVGIKAGEWDVADIADVFVMTPSRFLECSWHDPALGTERMRLVGTGERSEAELNIMLRNRESAALFGWNPFMHSPKLLGRLHRVDVPTLVVWGESDGIVSSDYGRAYAAAIPGARFELMAEAGHYPYLEQPERFSEIVSSFFKQAAFAGGD